MVRRLLIANRGEIAIRIARAARERGIAALGVFTDADAGALHRAAMEAAARVDSYLDTGALVEAARTLRADSVHPGYGFLSEQAAFAQAVIAAGLTFVGPPPSAIAAVGSKIEARRVARDLGLPVVDGYDGADQSAHGLRGEAERIGTPVLIKASAGGGGRGMRVVEDLARFDDALAAAQREALAAFGDGTVFLERSIARPRHVEVQILADQTGNVVAIGERECSVQRRHQKIVEEAPSPAVDPELRAKLCDAAVRFARAVGYENAGTIEFLLDGRHFYFLEMNARLQVEHPVTEMVYGVDLVGLQLDIAAGMPLPFVQNDLQPRGWAVEARVYAEDPLHDFVPSAGTIGTWEIPLAPGIRIDAGVRRGTEISPYYDALLAKVIAHSFEREAAIARLWTILHDARIDGIATNLALLCAVLDDEAFRRGDLTTHFISDRSIIERLRTIGDDDVRGAAAFYLQDGAAWRSAGIDVPLALDAGGRILRIWATRGSDGRWNLRGDLSGTIDAEKSARRDHRIALAPPPRLGGSGSAAMAGSGTVTAPMPGRILEVAVKPGDAVAPHALLVTLEAMKMEHRIEAPVAGTVREVLVAPGQLVTTSTMLVKIE